MWGQTGEREASQTQLDPILGYFAPRTSPNPRRRRPRTPKSPPRQLTLTPAIDRRPRLWMGLMEMLSLVHWGFSLPRSGRWSPSASNPILQRRRPMGFFLAPPPSLSLNQPTRQPPPPIQPRPSIDPVIDPGSTREAATAGAEGQEEGGDGNSSNSAASTPRGGIQIFVKTLTVRVRRGRGRAGVES